MSGSAASHDAVRPSTGVGHSRLLQRARAFVWERPWALVVWGTMVVWTTTLFVISYDRYADFRYARLDLGNMVQAVWSTAHGRPLETTTSDTGAQIVRLGTHVDPILAALAPLWMVAPTPLTLEAVQIVAVVLGALPLFWLGRRHLRSEQTAALLALAYLAYPWLAWNAIDALHPVTLAVPLLLFCVWFLDSDRLVAFTVCAVLVATAGELMGLVLAALGIWFAIAHRRREGLAIAFAGMGWTLFALYVVVPHYSGEESRYYGAFEALGGSPLGLLRTAITDPQAIAAAASEGRDFIYLFLLIAPLAAGFLLAPVLAAVALPQLAINLLADDRGTTDPHEHYIAAIVPFLFSAAAIGMARLSPPNRLRAVMLVLTASVTASLMVGPWPGTLLGAPAWDPLPGSPNHLRALEQAVSLVPDGAPVTATNRIGSRLAERRYFYSVPVVGRAEWVVLERADVWIPQAYSGSSEPEVLRAFELEIEGSPAWKKVFDEDGVLVLRKVRE
jgi:uncharacterized membrane protein